MQNSIKILVGLALISLGVVLYLDTIQNCYSEPEESQRLLLSHAKLQQEPITPIPESLPLSSQKVKLGEMLFHDVNLSHNKHLSCSSCHDLQKGGTDGLPLPITAAHQKSNLPNQPVFNSPTVFNSTFNFAQGWEGKTRNLAQQAAIPLFNTFEMGNTSWSNILNYLNQSPSYHSLFRQLYNTKEVQPEQVIDAISEFERSLFTPNARFDLYLKGDQDILSAYELDGYQLFKDRGCISCHHGINIGGNMFQKAGIFKPLFKNLGYMNNNEKLFKVPTLRNIAITAPYFHDGSIDNLEEAIDLMAKHQLGITLPQDENNKIQAFLKTLTGQYKGQLLSYE
ncbi:Cytochrome c551 peroxidase [hydrothermal vent metagenome]|uniref:Cytochrome c551 peroxidase n=1 Tax=hydrothermal vent metagenome TaxID=652676 RepID=A0A3B0WBE3_9ZZZZ